MVKKRGGDAARESGRERTPVVRVFISSPGDVADERDIARAVIDGELQKRPAYSGLKLEVIAWNDPNARIPMLANEMYPFRSNLTGWNGGGVVSERRHWGNLSEETTR